MSLGIDLSLVGMWQGGEFDMNSLFPAVGAWWDPSDLSTLFQDSAGTTPVTTLDDPIGRVGDKSGNGNHLLQPNNAVRPLYKTADGRHWIEGDGTQWMRATFAITQPWDRISALRQITWTASDRIYGGATAGNGVIIQATSSPNLIMASGVTLNIPEGILDEDWVLTERHNGANSRGAKNSEAYVTGNAGTNLPGGFTLFADNLAGNIANARLYGMVMRAGLMTDAQIIGARAYMMELIT